MLQKVLIANRGEIAVRIARAAANLDMESVSVYSAADAQSLHSRCTDHRVALPEPGDSAGGDSAGGDSVAAYLDIPALIDIAQQNRCDCLHPGYGFLSESAALAAACTEAGITFIGPSAGVLTLFGDKVAARSQAQKLAIPVIPGTAVDSVQEANAFVEQHGLPVMIKAAAGGGGRGMRAVHARDELATAMDRCRSEAQSAFGNGDLLIEKLLVNPRHIEVQVCGDEHGNVVHLFERDCSVQQRHQKLLEIAPAPNLPDDLRQQMLQDAVRLAESCAYTNVGTVEFLVLPGADSSAQDEYFFIECNPRIQVEHTVTEQVMGIDLVASQFQLANGASLSEVGLTAAQPPRGFAVQARIVAQGSGTITAYKEPAGPGVRVDSHAYPGYTPADQYDPLLAKLICSQPTGNYQAVLKQTARTLAEFHIQGLNTNIQQLQQILSQDALHRGDARTTLLDNLAAGESATTPVPGSALALLQQHARGLRRPSTAAQTSAPSTSGLNVANGQQGVAAPMAGQVVEVSSQPGQRVQPGETLLIISAMKMETAVTAPTAAEVVAVADLTPGDNVAAGEVVVLLKPSAAHGQADTPADTPESAENSWLPTLDEVASLQSLAAQRLADGSTDPGVVRQRSRGKLTCRERINLLLDPDSFREVGSVAGFASYNEDGEIDAFTPANHVGGWGTVDTRTTVVCADDFTSRGGHADGAIGAKSLYLDRLSMELRVPSVRLLDGSSGGGSVAAMVPAQKQAGESGAKESSGAIKAGRPRVAGGGGSFLPGHLGSNPYTEQLNTVPVVNMLLGSVVGIGAAKAVLGHFSVMVRDIAQLFVAGPPVVSHAMGYDISKEELGGWHIHCTNGAVDNLAESEEQAFAISKQFLSYLPASVYETPPVISCDDPTTRAEEELLTIIPRKRTTTFDMRRAISLMADKDSFFEIGPLWGTDQITGFVRFNGCPLGVIASDSRHVNGGALTADGCDKLKRHLDLCDVFHIPLLNLIDNPGFAVGVEHEMTATIRKGAEWMVAFAQINVPIFSVLMRRSFGVAGNNYATPQNRPSVRVAWPAADVGGIPPEGGIEAAYKRQLATAEDPAALRAELNARIESARGPLGPLNKFQLEEMIDPRHTRRLICEWVDTAYRIIAQADRMRPRALQFRP